MAAERAVFSSKTIFWLIAIGVVSFAGATYFMLYGDDLREGSTAGANAFSESAIGHRAFVETLRRVGVPVIVSSHGSLEKAGRSSLLVIAEPSRFSRAAAADAGAWGERVMLVLPKWQGSPKPEKPRWVEFVKPVPRGIVEGVLRLVVPDAKIRRGKKPVSWEAGQFNITPLLVEPQLMVSERLTPIVASEEGMLVGELREGARRVWVLSDPDILSNHGLGRGDNALLAVGLVAALRSGGGAVVVDETIHGFQREPSLWRALFDFPFVVSTIQAVAAVIVLMWAATGRFGAPLPDIRPLRAGKAGLIDNTASLLQFGGHNKEILKRYLEATLRDVGRRVHAPPGLDDTALAAWLDRIGEARGVRTQYQALRREVDALLASERGDGQRLLHAAHRLSYWKQEMLHGSGRHPVK